MRQGPRFCTKYILGSNTLFCTGILQKNVYILQVAISG